MLDDDDDLAPLRFLGSATIDTPVARVVADIRDTLGLQPTEFRAARNPDEAFRLLRSHAERAGIFVLLLGNLGSHHTDLDVVVFRGFALLDDFAPFVVVNPKDSAGVRSFTCRGLEDDAVFGDQDAPGFFAVAVLPALPLDQLDWGGGGGGEGDLVGHAGLFDGKAARIDHDAGVLRSERDRMTGRIRFSALQPLNDRPNFGNLYPPSRWRMRQQ